MNWKKLLKFEKAPKEFDFEYPGTPPTTQPCPHCDGTGEIDLPSSDHSGPAGANA